MSVCIDCPTGEEQAYQSNVHGRYAIEDGWGHQYRDGVRKSGINPVSRRRRGYEASPTHRAAYGALEGVCVFEAAGAPGSCSKQITPHHIWPRSQAGSLERADAMGVVAACSWHNEWAQEGGREWSTTHYFHRDGLDWPFLVTRRWLAENPERGR